MMKEEYLIVYGWTIKCRSSPHSSSASIDSTLIDVAIFLTCASVYYYECIFPCIILLFNSYFMPTPRVYMNLQINTNLFGCSLHIQIAISGLPEH